ncbi:MAG TPA: stage V sporulation protein AC [Bacillota bacterium]|nr:stage V sporulation protein AC [Bacillota bacterium]
MLLKKPQLNPEQQQYQQLLKQNELKPNSILNALTAFISGGIVCMIGQFFIDFYAATFNMPLKEASEPATATMILIGALLTGLGWFDTLASFAGAGIAVPVTGFANSIVAAALEYKREGFVLGIGSKIFSLAGSVITYGVVTAFFVGLLYSIFK